MITHRLLLFVIQDFHIELQPISKQKLIHLILLFGFFPFSFHFQPKQQQSIIIVGMTLLCISSLVSAQLSYHLDANTNSYTLQTPNSQQSFTRYFNGQPGAVNGIKATRAHPIQAAQSQQQPQQQVIFQRISLFFFGY